MIAKRNLPQSALPEELDSQFEKLPVFLGFSVICEI